MSLSVIAIGTALGCLIGLSMGGELATVVPIALIAAILGCGVAQLTSDRR